MIFDYMTLKVIWWLFIGVLMIGFAVTGGLDLGVATLLPIVGKTDDERRLILNSIGPTWEGNQVWLVTAGGAIFAAWPLVYAAAFSCLYFALLLVLFALILRPPGFDYRSKLKSVVWRKIWDWCLFTSGFVPALVLGVAFGNLLLGIPFSFDEDLRVHYSGGFFSLLTPFALLYGVVSLSMLVMQGGLFLQYKLAAEANVRIKKILRLTFLVFVVSFSLALVCTARMQGMQINSIPNLNGIIPPVLKTVTVAKGLWLQNYVIYKPLLLLPFFALLMMFVAMRFAAKNKPGVGIIFSSLSLIFVIFTVTTALFPFIMPSSLLPQHSLTIWDAVSSHKTLHLMFWAVLIFLPIIFAYTTWVYRIFRGKVLHISKNESY